ncbi:hypothetical protein BDQ12DRAFT_375422 [Crucibulum laeve]|uniref:RING-type domain-containing protein n=1 Tax=Crucibulum laeve TaxID=68775 RepID=A0A5C3LNH4_9AGAR|nr:hypothetical protein BDQ12DRAFT_375422 [Crucibulum laeve]
MSRVHCWMCWPRVTRCRTGVLSAECVLRAVTRVTFCSLLAVTCALPRPWVIPHLRLTFSPFSFSLPTPRLSFLLSSLLTLFRRLCSFEYAVSPCRTLCCGKMFCKEHIADWLHGPSSDGRCPACEKPCSVDNGVLSLVSPSLLPAASLSSRRQDSVSGNGSMSTRQRERSGTVVPSTHSFSTIATVTSPTTTEHTRGRSPSRSLATRSTSAASSGSSSSSASSSNSSNSTTVPSEAESPITSEDDESTPPRYSKRSPPMLSRVSSNESGTPTPRGRSAVPDVIHPSAVLTIDSSELLIPPEAQIKSSWKADLAPVEAAPEPPLTSGGYTLEGLGRVTSAVGLTLILYVLFSR